MIHQHPLAYLLGIEGLALLRAFTGEHDRAFVEARLDEVRRLLDDPSLRHAVDAERVDVVDGYRSWAPAYDEGANAAFDVEAPVLAEILDTIPPGVALDAACGTGRHTSLLARRGHRPIGVDASPDMLARARARVPEARFVRGDLHRLPVRDASVDLVVTGLALMHVPDIAPVLAEFARVLRPGGDLVVSDVHPDHVARGSVPPVRDAEGRPGRLVAHRHTVGDHVRAALGAGLEVRRCEEPVPPAPPRPEGPPPAGPGPWDVWPWSLAPLVPDAAAAAAAGVPAILLLHHRRPAS
ncbi:class I SAM-dependent methyltransferase [Actinomadura rifamycini]|uniref:class I SAM-dependent methyltransferase n=1 Tax=Actinomadura rifamycini TaxID=31962 RepID=UPI0004213B3D|nr:class I SAM-dependent methyltransferase [Actinomadura rifamycini]